MPADPDSVGKRGQAEEQIEDIFQYYVGYAAHRWRQDRERPVLRGVRAGRRCPLR